MNRNRLIVIGVIALVVATVATLKIVNVVRASMLGNGEPARVVVAARDLNVGQQLADTDLKVVVMPKPDLPAGVFSAPAQVIGRGVILPIQANELVLNSKLADPEAGAGLPSMIKPGMRAVSVKVNDVVSVAGFVIPGTHVDVIVTGVPSGNTGDPGNVTTTTVLQDVPVLAAGKKLQRDSQGQPQDVPVITLLVTPADAQLLTLASSEGKIQLALRNPTDVQKPSTNAVKNATLYGGTPAAAHKSTTKAKVVYAPKTTDQKVTAPVGYSIEVIRGDKREVNKFEGNKGN